MNNKYITFISNRKKIVLEVHTILYVVTVGKNIEIHVADGNVYPTRMTLYEVETNLGDGFIKTHRGCLVAARAIYDITDRINLVNGETLIYTLRKKKQIIEQFSYLQKCLIESFDGKGQPVTDEEYRKYYASFDNIPFAFTDIEMIFDDKKHATDWIFRYGNEALAKIEKIPLDKLIGNTFGSVFCNMDSKWLKCYERATLYKDVLEIMDYSPEVDTYLKIICFPTFEGHCGCILFDMSDIRFYWNSELSKEALKEYFSNSISNKN